MYRILHGDLWFIRSEANGSAANVRVCGSSDEIAVAFDKNDGTLVRHGTAMAVRAYVQSFQSHLARLNLANSNDFEIIVITMPMTEETVAELNACIETSGRVATIIERLSTLAPSVQDFPPARSAVPA